MGYDISGTTTFRAYYLQNNARGSLVPSWTDGVLTGGTDETISPGGTWATPGDPNTGCGIDIEFDGPTVVSGYGWAFADGFCNGFQRWQFWGSSDRTDWTLLSDPGEIWPSGYSAVAHLAYQDMFQLPKPAKYKYYRITIIQTMHSNSMSPAELFLTAKESEIVPATRTSWQIYPSGRNR